MATPPAERHIREELREHQTLVKDWQSKVRQGREYVKKVRLRHPLKHKDSNVKNPKVDQIETSKTIPTLKSLRDFYFAEIRPERKTAPAPSNSLELLFCESRKGNFQYAGDIEREPAMQLQKFFEGGEDREYYEYSRCLNIS